MSSSDDDEKEGVIRRRMIFCPRLQEMEVDELLRICPGCHDWFIYCCPCSMQYDDREKPCHHFRLVFTDGACRNNGQVGATAGIGVACGLREESQQSIPITKMMDQGHRRTSQRTELLAALAGLRYMAEADRINSQSDPKGRKGKDPELQDSKKSWIIATDSAYVVKGVTEWLPEWKNNNLRTKRNTKPANLDLFLRLDAALTAEENKQAVKIGFWHVPREYNTLADGLAKDASQLGDPE